MKACPSIFTVLAALIGFGACTDALQAQTLTYGKISSASITPGFEGPLFWDTDPFTGFAYMGIKRDGVFLEPTGTANLSLALTTPGEYIFDLRLQRGVHRDIASYQFDLFFDGHTAAPDITATAAPTAMDGQVNPFPGTLTYTSNQRVVDLTLLSITLQQPADDQVNEGAAVPDNVVDYVGHFTLRVTPVPEPAAVPLALSALLTLAARRHRPRASRPVTPLPKPAPCA